MDFVVKPISERELHEFSSILTEAALWLKQDGKEMWTESSVSPESLLQRNSIGHMFIGYLDHEAAATLILQEEDDLFWPETAKGQSLFLHKLAVRRKYANQGLAQEIIQWSRARAKALDKSFLRLDCAADRPKLCRFYESQGFAKVKEQVMFGKYPTAFYEYPLI